MLNPQELKERREKRALIVTSEAILKAHQAQMMLDITTGRLRVKEEMAATDTYRF